MKLQTFISEVVKQIEAGAKAAKAGAPNVIHMELKLNGDGDVCEYHEEPKAELKLSVYPRA